MLYDVAVPDELTRYVKCRSHAGDLDADAHARLVGLRQLLGDDSAWKETRARNGQGIYPVRFTVGGAFEEGSLQLLNGAGVVIEAARPGDEAALSRWTAAQR